MVPAGSLLKALSVGAKSVKGPGALRLLSSCVALSAATRVVNRPSAARVSTMLFLVASGPTVMVAVLGTLVMVVVVGAVVITVVVGTAVITAVVGAVVITVVSVETGVGVDVATGCCVVHPAINSVEKITSKTRNNVVFFIILPPFIALMGNEK